MKSTDLTSKSSQSLVNKVLGDPALYPDELKSWLPKWLKNNVNFSVGVTQLPPTENHHLVGASSEIAFGAGWSNFGGANEPARYWIDPFGVVHLGGIVIGGTGVIFTLPAGYRPQYSMIYAVVGNGAFAVVTVQPDGTVNLSSGTATSYLTLSGLTFRQYA